MPKLVLHTILLISVVTGVYFWLASPVLSLYTLQLIAVLILIFAGTHWTRHKVGAKPRLRNTVTLDLSLLTAAVLLLVTETGALASPFFFFIYFLLFAVSMLFEIETTLVLTAILVVYHLLLPTTDLGDLAHLSELLALVMITPLALFTGHEYEKLTESKRQNEIIAKHLETEETDTLVFLSVNLKKTLTSSLDKLSTIIPQEKVKGVQNDLETLYQDLKKLYQSAKELEQTIDRETD